MADVSNTIEYVYKLTDNVSATASQISQSSEKAQTSVDSLTSSQVKLGETSDEVSQKLVNTANTSDSARATVQQNTQLMTQQAQTAMTTLTLQLSILGTLKGAITSSASSMKSLGLISDDTAEALNDVGNAFSLIIGALQGLKAIQSIMVLINAQQAISASLQAFTQTLSNPAKLALVGAGVGAASAVAGVYLTTNNSSETNISVENTESTKATGNEIYSMLNGGAL